MNTKKQQKIDELDRLIGISREVITDTEVDEVIEDTQEKQLPLPAETKDLIEIDISVPNFIDDVRADYHSTRQTLKGLIGKAEKALEGIMLVANEGEHPRAYEVASTLIKTIADVSKDLLELQKTVRELSSPPGEGNNNTGDESSPNNPKVAMVGSFEQLLDMLDKVEEKKKDDGAIDGSSSRS